MTVYHLLQLAFKPEAPAEELKGLMDQLMGLKESCVHPTTNAKYILSLEGGANDSSEGFDKGFTHGFVFQFATKEDRDYYVAKDPAHTAFVQRALPNVKDICVVDFEAGNFGTKL